MCAHMMLSNTELVKRHDDAVIRIRQAISTGTCWRGIFLMDVGKRSEAPADVSGKANDLKEWMKVAPRSASGQEHPRPSKTDLIMLEQLIKSCKRLPVGQRIVLLDVGYTADTKPDEKRTEKWKQHSDLVDILTSLGFKMKFLKDTHCVPLGHWGTV
jgi:hypothetical protein